MIMSKIFAVAVQERRSIYGISNEKIVSDERIQEIIELAIKHTPSSFNSQSARVLVLLGSHQHKLWDITKETLRKMLPADSFAPTEEKITSFQNGYGTVLFFEDESVIQELQGKFALYKDNFPIWSQQSSGMLQFVVWTALEAEGLGASLQHYGSLIADQVSQQCDVPPNWKLIAQLPFGKPTAAPGNKDFKSLADRIKIFK
jgi:predicted oxidoreductase (fatty acid repression mutant protein)